MPKIVLVGDGAVGKSSLAIRLRTGAFPVDYVPTVFDEGTFEVRGRATTLTVHLVDVGSRVAFDEPRVREYADATLFVLCFDLANAESLGNVAAKWLPGPFSCYAL